MDDRSARAERQFQLPLLVAAVLTVPAIVLEETQTGFLRTLGTALNYATWLVFVAELVVMLALVPDRRRWLREHPLEVVVTILSPPFLLAAVQPVRALRLLRVLRLLRLAPLARALFSAAGIKYASILALLTALAGGEAFHEFEKNETVGNGIYWALTTMTTVGYGDPSPHTREGKFLAVAVMLVGIGFVALLTGAIAQRFLGPEVAAVEAEAERVEVAELDLLSEVREIASRLRRVEAELRRQGT